MTAHRAQSMRRVTIHSSSAERTAEIAALLALLARPGDRVLLSGPLGAGKTCFARGFAAGLGVMGEVSSPSFTLMHEHEGRIPLFHQDCYRLDGAVDAEAAGLLDPRLAAGVTLVEWAERLGPDAAGDAVRVAIDPGDGDDRTIVIEAEPDGRYASWLAAAADLEAGHAAAMGR